MMHGREPPGRGGIAPTPDNPNEEFMRQMQITFEFTYKKFQYILTKQKYHLLNIFVDWLSETVCILLSWTTTILIGWSQLQATAKFYRTVSGDLHVDSLH